MSSALRTSKDFGALIRDRRHSRRLSQHALAQAIGVSRLWVNQVERGKPRAELGLVLKALDMLQVRLTAGERDQVPGAPDIDAIVEHARRRQP
jgi:HTH-type transcriptional regulator/antitoxin HipB